MKTGRVRKKAESSPPKETTPDTPAPVEEAAPSGPPPQPRKPVRPARTPRPAGTVAVARKPISIGCIFAAVVAVIAILAIVMLLSSLGGDQEWIEATQASGTWTTSTAVIGPQVAVQEKWETDCISDPNGSVRTGTCLMKDSDTSRQEVRDDYEEFAYDIYFEETWKKTYQAQGTQFLEATLGSDDWWEGNTHYTRVEELDPESCTYTEYTVWVDDPSDTSQEVEVYLSECEVWDHVTATERIYDQKLWCQCDVTSYVQLGQQSDQGTGTAVSWPEPSLPAGARTEESFSGQVTFRGDDHTYTVSTDDPNQYRDFLTSQYYIGVKNDRPVTVSKSPPTK
jgi:hypothetical protein